MIILRTRLSVNTEKAVSWRPKPPTRAPRAGSSPSWRCIALCATDASGSRPAATTLPPRPSASSRPHARSFDTHRPNRLFVHAPLDVGLVCEYQQARAGQTLASRVSVAQTRPEKTLPLPGASRAARPCSLESVAGPSRRRPISAHPSSQSNFSSTTAASSVRRRPLPAR